MVTIEYKGTDPNEIIATKTDFVESVACYSPDRGMATPSGVKCLHELRAFYAEYAKAQDALEAIEETKNPEPARPWVRAADAAELAKAAACAEVAWADYVRTAYDWASECRAMCAEAHGKQITEKQTDAIRRVWRAMCGRITPTTAAAALRDAMQATRGNLPARKELVAALVDCHVQRSTAARACEIAGANLENEAEEILKIIETDEHNRPHWGVVDKSQDIAAHVDRVARWA